MKFAIFLLCLIPLALGEKRLLIDSRTTKHITMKFAIFLLCLIPLVLGEKRFIIDSILDTAEISKLVGSLIEKFGSDPSEQQCETECLSLFKSDILDSACDFACKGIQSLIKLVPHQVPATSST